MPRAGVLMIRSRLTESCGLTSRLQVRQGVLHLGALIEAEAAEHHVIAAVAPQRFFNLARLEVGAVQHGDAVSGTRRQQPLDGVGDEQRFLFAVESLEAA